MMNERITQLEIDLQSLLPKFPKSNIVWPVPDFDALKRLEERLRTEKGVEDSFKQKLKSAGNKNLKNFIATNLKGLFYNVGRFTWTGESSSNAKHGIETHKAQGLLCVQALVDCCEDVFGEPTDTITSAIGARLLRMNETKHRLDKNGGG